MGQTGMLTMNPKIKMCNAFNQSIFYCDLLYAHKIKKIES